MTGASAARLASQLRGAEPEPPEPTSEDEPEPTSEDEPSDGESEGHGTLPSAAMAAKAPRAPPPSVLEEADEEECSMVEELLHKARIHHGMNLPETRPTQTEINNIPLTPCNFVISAQVHAPADGSGPSSAHQAQPAVRKSPRKKAQKGKMRVFLVSRFNRAGIGRVCR